MRDYFASLKVAPPPTPERSNVVRLPERGATDGLHPYARAIRDAWTGRLANLPRQWSEGDAWDTNCFVTARKLLELANSPWAGYGRGEAQADYMAAAPRDHKWDAREKCWNQADKATGTNSLPEPPPGQEIPNATALLSDTPTPTTEIPDLTPDAEADFWAARPALTHLHTFARARLVSPWAVLGCALVRVVTATPFTVCLPPIVGSKASLNMFVGLVGPSGSGKGAAEAVAAEALDVGHIVSHNVGSGEGIAHGYKRRVKSDLEWLDDEHAVLFSVPEIDSLAAQGDRKGATLMPQLRSGWTGEMLGFGYADPTKRIIVEAHQYRLCLVAGIQPARAGCLLDDSDGGTPQRFLWLPATDPTAPDHEPDAPAPMSWTAPRIGDIVNVGGNYMKVCQTAQHTIKEARRARTRGDGDALDGHALLAQLKTAGALAVLDGRYEVRDDDWELAATIAAKSAATRAGVVRVLASKAAEANAAKAHAEAARAVQVSDTLEAEAVKKACNTLMRRLRKERAAMPGSELRKSLASKHRQHFEAALERLEEAGQVGVEKAPQGVRVTLSEVAS